MKVIVLGAGLVGAPMAFDLAADADFEVTVADRDADVLKKFAGNPEIKTICLDLSEAEKLTSLISDADMVLSAVPGFMGFQTLKTIIEAGKNVIDIAFFPEDLLYSTNLPRKMPLLLFPTSALRQE